VRLELRLGEKSPIARFYALARDRFLDVILSPDAVVAPGRRERQDWVKARQTFDAGSRAREKFVAAARELVGSRLPE
jgi:hypothetical protein